MAGVGRQSDRDLHDAAPAGPVGAEVILDVAGPAPAARLRGGGRGPLIGALKLVQDDLVRFLQHVGEHVQPPAMRHAHHHFPVPALGLTADRLIQHRDEHVRALNGEALLAGEGPVQELLERLDLRQSLQKLALLRGRSPDPEAPRLRRVAQPRPLLGIMDVVVVVAGCIAVDAPQRPDRLQGAGSPARGGTADHRGRQLSQVPVADAVRRRVQLRVARRPPAQRIEARGQVPVFPDRLGQRRGPDDPGHVRGRGRRGRRADGPARQQRRGAPRDGLRGRFAGPAGYGRPRLAVSAGGNSLRRRDQRRRSPSLEQRAGVRIDGLGVPLVSLIELEHIARIRAIEFVQVVHAPIISAAPAYSL